MEPKVTEHFQNRRLIPSPRGTAAQPFEAAELMQPTVSLFDEYRRTVGRNSRAILLFAVCGLLLSALLTLNEPPLYSTRTSLDIRSLNGNFMNMRDVAPTGDNSQAGADENLQTQIKLLQSDFLMQAVVDRLLREPHPASLLKQDLGSRMLRLLHLGGRAGIPYPVLVDDASKRVKVKPLGLTRLAELTCESYNAQFSALFCNTITQTFEDQDLHIRDTEARKTSDWLTKQVSDIRQLAEQSQRKLEAAVGGNGLMLSQTTTSPGEERLVSLQNELVRAEADRMQQQALSGVAHTAAPESLPEVQDNPEHRAYELKLADLQTQVAALVPRLTEENPKVILLRSQIAEAKNGLLATQRSSMARQDNELGAARHREQLLQIAYRTQVSTVSSDLQKAAQVTLLRRELESEQQLYQTLLQKAKEAGFATAMQADTIRVVDVAKAPRMPSSPRRGLDGSAGFALGALFGLGFAFIKERNNKVFYGPGEVPRLLHLHELGVIPETGKLPRSSTLALSAARPSSDLGQQGEAISLTRWNDDFSIAAEAYRNTTFSILLSDTGKRTHSYVVSSPNSGEGKTTVTSNLGVALSKSRLRVVLLDGDLRRPALHRAFGVPNDFGMHDILRGDVDLENTPIEELTIATGMSGISIIAAGKGRTDVVELLHSPYFGALLARLSREFDVILIDTPPILHMADARILAAKSDGAILVLRAGLTSHEQAASARDMFDHDNVHLVGSILNYFDPVRDGGRDYYGSYYRYQKGAESAEQVGASR